MIDNTATQIKELCQKCINGKSPPLSGLDLTIAGFVHCIPNSHLSDEIIEETFLRLLKNQSDLKKVGIVIEPAIEDKYLKSSPRNSSESVKLATQALKECNNFNANEQRLGSIWIEKDLIHMVLSKNLTHGNYSFILKYISEPLNLAGGNVGWVMPVSASDIVNFVLPQILEKFTILGLDDYQEEILRVYGSVNPLPMTSVFKTHVAPLHAIIELVDDQFKIVCGQDIVQKCFPFFRPVCSAENLNVFHLDLKFARVIKAFMQAYPEIVFATKNTTDSLEHIIELYAEPALKTINRGGIPQSVFAKMKKRFSNVAFEIYHLPKVDAIVQAAKNAFPNSKFDRSKNIITVKNLCELSKVRKIIVDNEIDVYSNEGNGYLAFAAARKLLTEFKDGAKATINYLGARRFQIVKASNEKATDYDFITESETKSLFEFIQEYKPTCDKLTLDALCNLSTLGAYRVMKISGRVYEVRTEHSNIEINFDFLPYHCIKTDTNKVQLTLLTASHVQKFKGILSTFGLFHKSDLDLVLPEVKTLIDTYQSRFEKSYTNKGSVNIDNFLGNDRLEPAQRGCVEYAIEGDGGAVNNTNILIGDEPGFGKTWESLAIATKLDKFPILVICPRIGKLSWDYEVKRLLPDKSRMVLGSGPASERDNERSMASTKDVVIINYDMLGEYAEALKEIPFKTMIVDESHYTKHESAQRTQYTHYLKDHIKPDVVLPLSGSHWENRPVEAISTLKLIGKLGMFGGEAQFKKRYCFNSVKKDNSGAINLDEMNEIFRTHFMIRRQKSGEGQPKWRQSYVPVADLDLKEYKKAEANLASFIIEQVTAEIDEQIRQNPDKAEYRQEMLIAAIKEQWFGKAAKAERLVQISTCRKLLGKAKADSSIEFIDSLLSQEDKLVVFAYHVDVQDALYKHFKNSDIPTVRISSEMSDKARKDAENEFMQGDARLIICALKAASENINLASASHVLFTEPNTKPMTQARMRIDRKPQKSNILNAWYLRAVGTIDDWLYDLCEQKQANFSKGSGDLQVDLIEHFNETSYSDMFIQQYLKP